jgi:N-glycosidase YbiA
MQPPTYNFYSHNPTRKGWCFSNFSAHPVTIGDKVYATTEHYFQAAKFFITDPAWAEEVRTATSPAQTKKMGRDRSHRIDPSWEKIKESVMLTALRAKVGQHPEVAQTLKQTGNAHLVEASPNDFYWGIGRDGTGKNRLGELLMVVRGELCKLSP